MVASTLPFAAQAQTERTEEGSPVRWRVAIGAQLEPSFPGASGTSIGPYFDVARARAGEEFDFEASDESAGFAIWESGGLAAGPSIAIQRGRDEDDLDILVPKVGTAVEIGGFVQYQLRGDIRLRGELRKGLGGHKGIIGTIGADYVSRDADRWLFAVGPRLTITDQRYQRAFFAVTPEIAATNGIAAYDSDGGVQAVGASATLLRQLSKRWGVVGYAKYDRLVAEPARSPLVMDYGSRDQFSVGLALSYSFGG
jgi:outer membrane scaffolding protein for murein synthesis (MipA/OmpV family)